MNNDVIVRSHIFPLNIRLLPIFEYIGYKRKDPRWAVRTVRIWVGIVLASLTFILTLLVLGAIYD